MNLRLIFHQRDSKSQRLFDWSIITYLRHLYQQKMGFYLNKEWNGIVCYCFLFLLFKMYQKVSNIELGGGYKGNTVITNTHYRVKGTFPVEQAILNQAKSKEIIVSTHKIPGKVSPGKYKIYSHQTSRHGSVLENENSFLEMKDSSISSPIHMVKAKSPLRDASNQSPSNLQSRQFVRVNFISNSPECSRTSSTHLREFRQSPSKMVTCIAADKDTRN